jgi:hypothetical protein
MQLRLEEIGRKESLAKLTGWMFAIVPVVIVVIPIAVGAPTVAVFIPPAMVAGVAILAGFVQLMASVFGLATLAPMMLDGFVKTVIRLGDAPLATVLIGAQTRSASEEQKSRQRRTH